MTISEDKKKRVIDLYYNQGKTTREIAKIERMSIRDISAILKEEQSKRQKHKDQQQLEELSSKAYDLFSEGKTTVEVAVALNLREPEATKLYREYWRLKRLHKLNLIYRETNGKLGTFLKLYNQLIKKNGMSIDQVVNAVEIAIHKLPHMESLYEQVKDQVDKMQRTRQMLANDIAGLERKISILDKIAFYSEQECKKKEYEVQELSDKKDRLEKLIANILNGEGYSNLKQIVKENVKVVLSENRKLISISFVALIQTLKDDPEMIKLIYNIFSANDGEINKDNDINVTKYLEFNKDSILELTEKNYKNLLEALTNNVMNTAANSSYNPTLSLPQSSSTFNVCPDNQSDIFRKEDPGNYHNSKGDIAD